MCCFSQAEDEVSKHIVFPGIYSTLTFGVHRGAAGLPTGAKTLRFAKRMRCCLQMGNAEQRPGRTQQPAFSLRNTCDHRVQPPRGRGSLRLWGHPGRSGGAS